MQIFFHRKYKSVTHLIAIFVRATKFEYFVKSKTTLTNICKRKNIGPSHIRRFSLKGGKGRGLMGPGHSQNPTM
jgi:hypothetical protein